MATSNHQQIIHLPATNIKKFIKSLGQEVLNQKNLARNLLVYLPKNENSSKVKLKHWRKILKTIQELTNVLEPISDFVVGFCPSTGKPYLSNKQKVQAFPITDDPPVGSALAIAQDKAFEKFNRFACNTGKISLNDKTIALRIQRYKPPIKSKKKTAKVVEKINHLDAKILENAPLQYMPLKFYCWDPYYNRFLFQKQNGLVDGGCSCAVIDLSYAKTSLPSFLENKKCDRTLQTAKTGDTLYVVGITRQQTCILAYKERSQRMEYKAIMLNYLVVVGVAHNIILGQTFFQHPSFLAYDGKRVFLVDKVANPFKIKAKLNSYVKSLPVLSVDLCDKNETNKKGYDEADAVSGHTDDNFLELSNDMPLSSEAYKFQDGYKAKKAKVYVILNDNQNHSTGNEKWVRSLSRSISKIKSSQNFSPTQETTSFCVDDPYLEQLQTYAQEAPFLGHEDFMSHDDEGQDPLENEFTEEDEDEGFDEPFLQGVALWGLEGKEDYDSGDEAISRYYHAEAYFEYCDYRSKTHGRRFRFRPSNKLTFKNNRTALKSKAICADGYVLEC